MVPGMISNLRELANNVLLERTAWLKRLLDPRRDIDAECGHPETIEIKDYAKFYERGDVARRVVNLYPEESWSDSPEVLENEDDVETEFEEAWKQLAKDARVFHYLQRADIMSGIGRFGVLLLGLDDGKELKDPVDPAESGRQLIYLRPFEEYYVDIAVLENDPRNPRYGLPQSYNIQFADTGSSSTSGGTKQIKSGNTLNVHHSRVIHLADHRQNSDVYGRPRMEVVMNRLLDLRKIAGGSGEMFYKGGFPGLSLQSLDPEGNVTFDKEATQEQMDKYMNGLQRYIALVGMEAKSLAPQVADPGPHAELQLKLIAISMGVPWRVFIGSEQAQLASGQDMKAWNQRVNRRREEYCTPFILRPFIDRMMEVGVLPQVEDYDVKWEDLNSPSDQEKADVTEKRTNALAKYVQSGSDTMIPPFHFLTLILEFSDDEANAIIEAAEERLADELAEEQQRLEEEAAMLAEEQRQQAAAATATPAPRATAPSQGNE